MARDVGAYLAKLQRDNGAEFHDELMLVEEQYGKRLWHQLTISVTTLFNNAKFRANNDLKEFHEKFLSEFDHRYLRLSACELLSISSCLQFVLSLSQLSSDTFVAYFAASSTLILFTPQNQLVCLSTLCKLIYPVFLLPKDSTRHPMIFPHPQNKLVGVNRNVASRDPRDKR